MTLETVATILATVLICALIIILIDQYYDAE